MGQEKFTFLLIIINFQPSRSEAMSNRNALFKKANDMLVSEGISAEKAVEIVHQAFEDRNRIIGMDDTVLCKERTIICDKASIFRCEFFWLR